MLRDELSPAPKYVVEASLAVSAPEREVNTSSPPWRIEAFELISGRHALAGPPGAMPG